jgi:hypothetical protein
VCNIPVVTPGGKPTIADPGHTPTSPLTLVSPVLVTVEPARIPKLQAAPAATGAGQGIGVKVQTKSAAIGTPVSLRTAVVTVAV